MLEAPAVLADKIGSTVQLTRPPLREGAGLSTLTATQLHADTDAARHGDGPDVPPSISEQRQEDLPELDLRPRHGWIAVDWKELYHYRELLYFLTWRDFKVRYKQTVLGVLWAVLVPVAQLLVFTLVFGAGLGVQDRLPEGMDYAVFAYAGLLPWTFFQMSVNFAALSLVNQQQLLTKIYFPRMFVPTSAIGAGLVDFAISAAVFAVVMAIYMQPPAWTIVLVPVLLLFTVMAALGFGYLLAALTVAYRDFRYVIPFMLQGMMFISPVIWPVTIVPEQWRWVVALNPMTGIIEGYRLRDPRHGVGLPHPGRLGGDHRGAVPVRDGLLPQDRTPLRRHRLAIGRKKAQKTQKIGKVDADLHLVYSALCAFCASLRLKD